MRRMTLKVEGMRCAHCEMRVRQALTALPGVEVLEVSAAENHVLLALKENSPGEAALKAAVESTGYRVS